MPSLNEYAQQLADSFNRPYDAMFLERVKQLIVQERATYLQRTMDKDGVDKEYRQTYYAAIQLVNKKEITNPTGEAIGTQQVYKTVNRIPKPIRWKNYTPFFYVGREDGDFAFRIGNYYTGKLNKLLPLIGEAIVYDYIDGYIYVFPNIDENGNVIPIASPIRIDEVIQNPRFVRTNNASASNANTLENCQMFTDDMEFPMPLDMVNSIKLSLKELFITDHKDILQKTHIDNA
jgi:hypothetical protein